MAKVTDTIRILVGLRDGCRFTGGRGHRYGRGHAFFEHDLLYHPDGQRVRSIGYSYVQKAMQTGLVERGPDVDPDRRNNEFEAHSWILTEAGQAAAAALPEIPVDGLFVVVVTSPKVLEAARNKATARKIFKVLTFNAAKIRDNQVKFVGGASYLIDGFASAYRWPLSDAVMAIIQPPWSRSSTSTARNPCGLPRLASLRRSSRRNHAEHYANVIIPISPLQKWVSNGGVQG